ncbi:MAG TPA: hypothetical protein VFC02_04990 [Anaerolineales bacterium]|jgi:hypothetical protein|nr:hypothetical protein [Anaerolineales bacterium]
MKRIVPAILLAISLTSCNGWVIQPVPGNPPTPFLPATSTPPIFTATSVIIASATPNISTATTAPTNTFIPAISNTPTLTLTSLPSGPSISVEVLGCNTSIDVTHGMGEVTNAFVTLRNTGGVSLTNLKTTLFALDEGREHPDKTIETTLLPVGFEVTLKLTVDSTYQQETPIQIEVIGDNGLFQRVGSASCRDIGVLMPNPDGLYTPVPTNP